MKMDKNPKNTQTTITNPTRNRISKQTNNKERDQ